MARPTKLTPACLEQLLGALRAGNTREAAAAYAGIDRTTLYRWLGRDTGLRAQVEHAEAEAQVRLEAQVAQAGGTDWRAAAWLLERRWPKSYGRAQAMASAGAEAATSAPAPHPLDHVSPGEAAQWAAEYAAELATQAAPDAAGGGTP